MNRMNDTKARFRWIIIISCIILAQIISQKGFGLFNILCTKDVMQGKLIAVVYALCTY